MTWDSEAVDKFVNSKETSSNNNVESDLFSNEFSTLHHFYLAVTSELIIKGRWPNEEVLSSEKVITKKKKRF